MRLWQVASCNRLVVNRLTKTKPWHHGLLSSLCPNSTYTLSVMNITYTQAQSDINQITFWAFHCSTDNDTHSACDSFREWVWVWHWSDVTLYDWYKSNIHTHTHPFNGPFSGTTQVSRYQIYKKPIWILLKQETVSGSGISWDIYKSANHSRQITTPAPHCSVYLQALPVAQPTASKHWRQKKTTWRWLSQTRGHADELATGLSLSLHRTIADSCQQNQSCSDRPLLFFANWKHFCSSQPGDTRIQTVYRQFCDVPSVCQQVHNINTPVTVIATNQLG